MKKRILSIVLATLLIAAMAIPASATVYDTTGTYGGCTYHSFSYCASSSFQSLIELSDCSGNAEDYVFYVLADVYFSDERGFYRMYDRYEDQSTYIASVTRTINENLQDAVCTQRINNTTIFEKKTVSAS